MDASVVTHERSSSQQVTHLFTCVRACVRARACVSVHSCVLRRLSRVPLIHHFHLPSAVEDRTVWEHFDQDIRHRHLVEYGVFLVYYVRVGNPHVFIHAIADRDRQGYSVCEARVKPTLSQE